MKKIIIVPDIHGRTFWQTLKKIDTKEYDIIFLGDYLDPYNFENIPNDDALANFKEIIEFKKNHTDNVTLLLGNHDTEYFAGTLACRMDYANREEIKTLFMDNLDLFNLGATRTINGKEFSFTHSCITKEWVNTVNKYDEYDKREILFKDVKNPYDVITTMNQYLHNGIEKLSPYLNVISRNRGGRSWYGSPIWAHWDEINKYTYEYDEWYQVFGHSQQITYEMENEIYDKGYTDKLAPPIIEKFYACLDCKQLFTINENNEIELYQIEYNSDKNE